MSRWTARSGIIMPARPAHAGIAGFDGSRPGDYALAIGSVRGLRQWSFPAAGALDRALAAGAEPSARAIWPVPEPLLLTGVRDHPWRPGVNEAACRNNTAHEPPVEADPDTGLACGCGFWAYWGLDDHAWDIKLPVFGVVEGTGRVVTGTKGFRCQKARILALTLGFTVEDGPEKMADAWLGVLMDMIGQAYPDARVFATLNGMLASVPTGEFTT
jgi:hypothetical protein